MKKRITSLLLMALIGVLAGCGLTSREIRNRSLSERTDVFKEVTEGRPLPAGYVDLVVRASIKTHLEGYYFHESQETFHGQPGYPFLINIDGQANIWKIEGQKESTPKYDEHGRRDAEGGEGQKYTLNQRIRLHPGLHKLFFSLPGEDYCVESDLLLVEGRTNILEFKPIYNSKRGSNKKNFLYGLSGGELFFNGKLVQ
jgi:hypothetical protein